MQAEDPVDWVDCPQCGLPAYVVDRFVRPSTDGPLPHAVTVCPQLHHLCTTDERTSGAVTDEEAPAAEAPAKAEDPAEPGSS